MKYKASAPGSLMILGEYAVLHEYPALVCAIDKRVTMTLIPREDETIHIHSALGELETSIFSIDVVRPFEFVLAVLKFHCGHFVTGFDLYIETDFASTLGFGSSAAVTVATMVVLTSWLDLPYTQAQLIKIAREMVRTVQGVGSGADIAACVYGGVLSYRADPLEITPISDFCPISVVYSGKKTPTAQAILHVQAAFSSRPVELSSLIDKIGECAKTGIDAANRQDWQALGRIMDEQQKAMAALNVSTPLLESISQTLRDSQDVYGAKISGSGLGDCVIGVGAYAGDFPVLAEGVHMIPVSITTQGAVCEKDWGY